VFDYYKLSLVKQYVGLYKNNSRRKEQNWRDQCRCYCRSAFLHNFREPEVV